MSLAVALANVQEAVSALALGIAIDAEVTELKELATALVWVREQHRELSLARDALEGAVARAMTARRVELPGVGLLERRSGMTRRNYDTPLLLSKVVARGLELRFDRETGEVTRDGPTAVADALSRAARLEWRVTGLRDLGIDGDEYCEQVPGPPRVQITPPS